MKGNDAEEQRRRMEEHGDSQTSSPSTDDIVEIRSHSSSTISPSATPHEHKTAEPAFSEIQQQRPVPIPRGKRRGWLSNLSIVAEVQEPKDYENRTKWFITFIVAIAAAAAPVGSSIVLRTACLYVQKQRITLTNLAYSCTD